MPQNIFAQGMDAFKDGYATQQTMRQDRARTQAGRALAAGDRSGAATAFGEGGLTDDVRRVQSDQTAADETTYQHGQDAQKQTDTDQAKRAAFLKDISKGLKGVPAGQRKAALDQVLPHFQQLGLDPEQFAGLTEDQLTDQNLDIFSGEIDKHQLVNMGSGGVGDYDPRSGDFRELRAPDKPIILGNGATALDPVTHQPIYTNPKTFAPPRPRAPGKADANAGTLQAIEAELRRRGKL